MKPIQLKNSQSGFTLIELVVVIVILGILAATALPKFVDLQTDARVASITAGKGAVGAAANLAHGAYLAKGSVAGVTLEGVTYTLVNGYPAATDIVTLAGLSSEYQTTAGTGSIEIGLASKPACKFSYAEASGTVPPTITASFGAC